MGKTGAWVVNLEVFNSDSAVCRVTWAVYLISEPRFPHLLSGKNLYLIQCYVMLFTFMLSTMQSAESTVST